MDFHEILEARSSTREFTREEVSPEVIDTLLACACRAPTAGNLQPWRFFVVRDVEAKRGLMRAAHGQTHVGSAPVVLMVCADLEVCARGYGPRGVNLYAIQDTAAAVENILLAAVTEGLGSCWVGAFDERVAADVLGLPQGTRPLAMVALGHPAGRRSRTPREPHKKFTQYV
ncbi:MAG: nitroreductase family protein [Candidatus Geothermincolia bacterium]